MASQKVVSSWVFGAVIAFIGLVIRLGGHWLARVSVGSGAYTTDPHDVQNYEGIGTIILIFGLVLFAIAFARWLWLESESESGRKPGGI